MTNTTKPTLTLSSLACAVILATGLAGCTASTAPTGSSSQAPASSAKGGKTTTSPSSAAPTAEPVQLKANVEDGAKGVKVDKVVKVEAANGKISTVKLSYKGKDKQGDAQKMTVPGALSPDGKTWTASSRLDPAAKYKLSMEGTGDAGQPAVKDATTFTTQKLSLKDQTFSSISPRKGAVVGVGMPVVLTFDVGIKNRKQFEKHLSVTSTPQQGGTWRWYGDKQVHFRPQHFWKPGTKVKVKANLNGLKAGHGIYGQNSTSTSFTVGRSVVTKISLKSKQAKVYIDHKLARKIPISGGKPGWSSRSGTKVIIEKIRMTRMTNESIGAKEHYDFKVPFAMRVTTSGEFLHAAPWKEGTGQFGHRNTSHGCVGMSTANARWLFHHVRLGDPVITTGSHKHLEQGNGYADWNISYHEYKQGSAL